MAPVYWVFNTLLGSLIILHIIWGSIIINMVIKFTTGGLKKDERSDSEEEEEEEGSTNNKADPTSLSDRDITQSSSNNHHHHHSSTGVPLVHTPRKLSSLEPILDSPRQSDKNRLKAA